MPRWLSLSGPGSELRLRAVATVLRRHERMLPDTGLVSVTHTRDHEGALAYPIPPAAVPRVVASLAASAEG
eukprot:6163522-Alexandrium_andersonii.AAC.1